MKEGQTREEALNVELAKQLRRRGVSAFEEQGYSTLEGETGVIDIAVDMGEFCVAIEAEWEKGADPGKKDADKRLRTPPILFQGKPIIAALAVGYPNQWSFLYPAQAYQKLADTDELRVAHRFRDESWSPLGSFSIDDLAFHLLDFWTKTSSGREVDRIAKKVSDVIDQSAEILESAGGETGEKGSDPAATKALIWLNALLFQELLAANLDSNTLPEPHRGTRIVRPDMSADGQHLAGQWQEILDINWHPIFEVAKKSLESTPPQKREPVLTLLKVAADDIAGENVIRQHDVAGRIFHRLLDTRKFLATNYTSIPAAIILAGLTFDPQHPLWDNRDFNLDDLKSLRIVDPACGSGTLLMASLQEMIRLARSLDNGQNGNGNLVQTLLENCLYGFDVVPAAIHLAATTLQMAESSRLISETKLWRMNYGVDEGGPRLGSLDMLKNSPSRGNAMRLGLFPDTVDGYLVAGLGEVGQTEIVFPPNADIVIANPPYPRAGGPGDDANEEWNPIFGALPKKGDREIMINALRDTLVPTPASMYAGLGSAFIVLAEENVKEGGRIAFVLPITAATGTRWARIRELLLDRFEIDWVIVSHEPGKRVSRKGIPGRVFSSFSELTNISEMMLIATRKEPSPSHKVRFVNLAKNPLDTISAQIVTRLLLESSDHDADISSADGKVFWGQTQQIEQSKLSGKPWSRTAFVSKPLSEIAHQLSYGRIEDDVIPLTRLTEQWKIGPYHVQIKSRKQGLFHVDENVNRLRDGYPAVWKHKQGLIRTIKIAPNAWLTPHAKKSEMEQEMMWERSSKLLFGLETRLNTQRVVSVMTEEPVLGISSWVSLQAVEPKLGVEETICLWLNSTLGILLRVMFSNRPYMGRSRMTHTSLRDFPILDVMSLSDEKLEAGLEAYKSINSNELKPLHLLDKDGVRARIDYEICNILGLDLEVNVRSIAEAMAREPGIHGGKR